MNNCVKKRIKEIFGRFGDTLGIALALIAIFLLFVVGLGLEIVWIFICFPVLSIYLLSVIFLMPFKITMLLINCILWIITGKKYNITMKFVDHILSGVEYIDDFMMMPIWEFF